MNLKILKKDKIKLPKLKKKMLQPDIWHRKTKDQTTLTNITFETLYKRLMSRIP
jgi:hypothetical protein